MSMKTNAMAFGAALTLWACGDETGGGGSGLRPVSDDPTITVEVSPLCMNFDPFPVANETRRPGTTILNIGRRPLIVRGARISDELRPGTFTLRGISDPEAGDCSSETPCTLEFGEFLTVAVDYTPTSAGWDRALVEIESNDPRFQTDPFRLSIVSAAISEAAAESIRMGTPVDAAVDFGDRPDVLRCTCRDNLPDDCP